MVKMISFAYVLDHDMIPMIEQAHFGRHSGRFHSGVISRKILHGGFGGCHFSRIHKHMSNDVTSVNTISHPSIMTLMLSILYLLGMIEEWGIDFIGPISPTLNKKLYIISRLVIARIGLKTRFVEKAMRGL